MEVQATPQTDPKPPGTRPIQRVRCINPFMRCEINKGFVVTPCCEAWCKGGLGELKQAELAEVWNAETYQELRRQMAPGGDPTYYCDARKCPELRSGVWYDLAENPLCLPPELIEEIAAGKTRIENGPVLLQITNDFRCNLRCVMCSAHDRLGDKGDDAVQALEQVKGSLSSIREIFMLGSGEVFAHGELLDAMQRLNGRDFPNTQLSLFSNGTLITPARWGKLDSWAMRLVNVSVDGATRETYEKIRRGARWDSLMASLDLLRRERDRGRLMRFHMNMTVMRSNCHEVAMLAHRALEWGVDSVFFRWAHSYAPETILDPVHWESLETIEAQLGDPVFLDPRVDAVQLFDWPNLLPILPPRPPRLTPGMPREPVGEIRQRIRQTILADMHRSALGAPPSDTTKKGWDLRFDELRKSGADGRLLPAEVGLRLFSSDAYRNRRRSHAEFVGDLYRVLLRREPGSGEVEYWAGEAATRDPMDLALQFLSSEEFENGTLGAFHDGGDFASGLRVNRWIRRLWRRKSWSDRIRAHARSMRA